MQWAQRRLEMIEPVSGGYSSALDNIHGSLNNLGLLQTSSGQPTRVGRIIQSIIGKTPMQRNLETLNNAFNEFLNILEESINNQLTHSIKLFAGFGSIDRGFQNLHRIVMREDTSQDLEQAEMLSSLWVRVLGARASEVRKFERNRQLLASLRNQTLQNKHTLKEHNNKLLQMKSTLDMMRRKIASQLVRSTSDTPPIGEQLQGLSDAWEQLKGVRDQQKQKTLSTLYQNNEGGLRREIGMGTR